MRQIALDRGLSGPILGPSAYFMKSPPVQYTDSIAREMVEDFISNEASNQEYSLDTNNKSSTK